MNRLIFALIFIVLGIQIFYINNLNKQLELRKNISVNEIKQLIELGARLSPEISSFDGKDIVASTVDCPKITYLDEVEGYENNDVIARIDLLKDHLNFEYDKPSSKWIKDVVVSAKNEIIKLRDSK